MTVDGIDVSCWQPRDQSALIAQFTPGLGRRKALPDATRNRPTTRFGIATVSSDARLGRQVVGYVREIPPHAPKVSREWL